VVISSHAASSRLLDAERGVSPCNGLLRAGIAVRCAGERRRVRRRRGGWAQTCARTWSAGACGGTVEHRRHAEEPSLVGARRTGACHALSPPPGARHQRIVPSPVGKGTRVRVRGARPSATIGFT
jgi:hypothetical protein